MSDEHHLCPWWVGYLLANPLRKLVQDPDEILAPYVSTGMTTLDFGCAMGFFSLPLARLVGPQGRVLCVDCQPFMLDRLLRRARRARLEGALETRLAENGDFGLTADAECFDFALAFAVVHEVADPAGLFRALHASLRPRALLLVGEPAGHVSQDAFATELARAQEAGLLLVDRPHFRRSHTALLQKAA